MLKCLYELDTKLAQAFLDVTGESLEDVALVLRPSGTASTAAAPSPPLDARAAEAAYAAALYAAADALDVTAKALRATSAALLPRLAQARLTLEQAAALAKPTDR